MVLGEVQLCTYLKLLFKIACIYMESRKMVLMNCRVGIDADVQNRPEVKERGGEG